MITNPAWFALLPVILLVSPASVSAKERIVPAVCEPVQVIAVNTAWHPGKTASAALLCYASVQAQDHDLPCASCYTLVDGVDDKKSSHVRFKEFGRVSNHQGISDNKLDPIQIDREKS